MKYFKIDEKTYTNLVQYLLSRPANEALRLINSVEGNVSLLGASEIKEEIEDGNTK